MARRKKSRKMPRRRSRVGAVKGGAINDALGLIAGAALAGVVKKLIPGEKTSETIKNAVVIGAGLFTPRLLKGRMGANLGAGMIAYGGVGLVKGLVDPSGKFIAGMEDTLSIPVKVGQSDDNLSVIAGAPAVMAGDALSVLAGYDEENF